MQRGLDGFGGKGAVGLRFDEGAGGWVPEVDEAGVEGRGGNMMGRCAVASRCEGVVEPSEMAVESEAYQAKE